MKIDFAEVVFDPASVADTNGRVFWWRGSVYRAVTERAASLYRTLLESGAFERLIDAGMIGTEISSLSVDGYDLVLSHDTIRFRSYPFEWCNEMLKDAALLTCDVNLALASIGLSTQDAHCWNVLFDGPMPKFVDVGSIAPGRGDSASWARWYAEFQDYFLYPLYLMSVGQGATARRLLSDVDEWVSRRRVATFLPAAKRFQYGLDGFLGKPARFRSPMAFLQHLRRSVEAVELPECAAERSGHDEEEFPPMESSQGWSQRHQAVFEVLQRLRPSSVVDLGSSQGGHAKLAARMGIPVVALDEDEWCVKALYADAAKHKIPVLPLIMDACAPSRSRTSPKYGDSYPAAQERLRGELVLALAMMHRLVFQQGLSLDEVVERLAAFSGRWLLVESMPPPDCHASPSRSGQPDWYSEESLVAALGRRFARVELLDSTPAPQTLLLCER